MIMITVSFLLGMILCLLFGVPYIDFLKKKMIGQYVKELAPEAHMQKQGTPTTGGVFIIIAVIIACAAFINRCFYYTYYSYFLYICRFSG